MNGNRRGSYERFSRLASCVSYVRCVDETARRATRLEFVSLHGGGDDEEGKGGHVHKLRKHLLGVTRFERAGSGRRDDFELCWDETRLK